MSPTVKSAGVAAGVAAGVVAVCASASAHRTASATAARAVRVFILQPPVSPLSALRGAPETLGNCTIRGLETHACSFENSAPPQPRLGHGQPNWRAISL